MTQHPNDKLLFGGRTWRITPDGREFGYRWDEAAAAIRAEPAPTEAELAALYGDHYDYRWFELRRGLKRLQARDRFRRLRTLIAGHVPEAPRLLDIGCGHGWFLAAARDNGWGVHGLDRMAPDMRDALGETGIPYTDAVLEDAALRDGSFDIITMWHSLEHFLDPAAALEAAARWLRPGGLLFIAVPNGDSAGLECSGADWVWLQAPFVHPWCLSAESLRRIVPDGIAVVRLTSTDTWDGQLAFSTLPFRAYRFALKRAVLWSNDLHPRGSILLDARARAFAALDEAPRLLSHAVYRALPPRIRSGYEEGLRASELNAVLRREPGR